MSGYAVESATLLVKNLGCTTSSMNLLGLVELPAGGTQMFFLFFGFLSGIDCHLKYAQFYIAQQSIEFLTQSKVGICAGCRVRGCLYVQNPPFGCRFGLAAADCDDMT